MYMVRSLILYIVFIPRYSARVKSECVSEIKQAFQEIRERLIAQSSLAHLDHSQEFVLDTYRDHQGSVADNLQNRQLSVLAHYFWMHGPVTLKYCVPRTVCQELCANNYWCSPWHATGDEDRNFKDCNGSCPLKFLISQTPKALFYLSAVQRLLLQPMSPKTVRPLESSEALNVSKFIMPRYLLTSALAS